MAKTAVIVVSDPHINSKVGLRCPSIQFDDGDESRASKEQRQLWRWWLDFRQWSHDLTKGYRRVLVMNGDLVDVDSKKRTNQVHSRNISEIQNLAINTIEPMIDFVDGVYIIRGTEAHVGGSGEHEEMIARDLDHAIKDEERDTFSWWHYTGVANGTSFDIAHHVSMGRLPHTERNAANKLAFLARWHYLNDGKEPPDVVIRSHVHRYADSGRNYPTFAVITSAWTWKTGFIYRIGGEMQPAEIGGMVFLCDGNDDYRFFETRYKLRQSRRSPWTKSM